MNRPPRLLSIAGSDSGGGAGIQADLKTFAAHGAYGMTAITAVTAQNTVSVRASHPVPPEMVAIQIEAVFRDLGVDAVKIGMLANAEIVEAVAASLTPFAGPPIVVDPVMVAKSGDRLLDEDAVSALVERILPLATVVTPNVPEAEDLLRALDAPAAAEESVGGDELAWELRRRLGQRGCSAAVLLKGGHDLSAGDQISDWLVDGDGLERFTHPRVDTKSTHGTGCTLSAALAARLGAGTDLRTATGGAIDYLQRALESAVPLGAGHGPVNHLHVLKPE